MVHRWIKSTTGKRKKHTLDFEVNLSEILNVLNVAVGISVFTQ